MSGMDVDSKSNMSGLERTMLDAWRTKFEVMQSNYVYQDNKTTRAASVAMSLHHTSLSSSARTRLTR